MKSKYQDLIVRQKAIVLAEKIYETTKEYPKEEVYWLTSQMRRAVVSISSNIAEWSLRNTDKEFGSFLYNARWSAAELETQIILSGKLGFLKEERIEKLLDVVNEILKMLSWLIATLK